MVDLTLDKLIFKEAIFAAVPSTALNCCYLPQTA